MTYHRLDQQQVKNVIDSVVPLIATPEDESAFRGLLWCYADSCSKFEQFARLVANILETADKQGD